MPNTNTCLLKPLIGKDSLKPYGLNKHSLSKEVLSNNLLKCASTVYYYPPTNLPLWCIFFPPLVSGARLSFPDSASSSRMLKKNTGLWEVQQTKGCLWPHTLSAAPAEHSMLSPVDGGGGITGYEQKCLPAHTQSLFSYTWPRPERIT